MNMCHEARVSLRLMHPNDIELTDTPVYFSMTQLLLSCIYFGRCNHSVGCNVQRSECKSCPIRA